MPATVIGGCKHLESVSIKEVAKWDITTGFNKDSLFLVTGGAGFIGSKPV